MLIQTPGHMGPVLGLARRDNPMLQLFCGPDPTVSTITYKVKHASTSLLCLTDCQSDGKTTLREIIGQHAAAMSVLCNK